MCQRDARGRVLPGSTPNPRGRPEAGAYDKLLAQAARVGADVIVLIPPKAATVGDTDPVPSAAA